MCKVIGIDVSKHQGTINWSDVKKDKNEIDFVIMRAGYGKGNKDVCFENNYLGAKRVGLPVGVYWYCYASNANEALDEAKACVEILKGKQIDLPIFYDVEEAKSFRNSPEIIETFCSYLENKGYFTGVYCSESVVKSYCPGVTARYAGWIANWTKKPANIPYKVWQYSSKGAVKGITGAVDMDNWISEDDFLYVQEYIYRNGLNGYARPEPLEGDTPIPNVNANETVVYEDADIRIIKKFSKTT